MSVADIEQRPVVTTDDELSGTSGGGVVVSETSAARIDAVVVPNKCPLQRKPDKLILLTEAERCLRSEQR